MKDPESIHIPGQRPLDRKEKFAALLSFVHGRGWVTSVPGATLVMLEVLPGSDLPEELRELGFQPQADGEGERILPHAIREVVTVEGSTVPKVFVHAGIVAVKRYSFAL